MVVILLDLVTVYSMLCCGSVICVGDVRPIYG